MTIKIVDPLNQKDERSIIILATNLTTMAIWYIIYHVCLLCCLIFNLSISWAIAIDSILTAIGILILFLEIRTIIANQQQTN
jgi:hypothetical protein